MNATHSNHIPFEQSKDLIRQTLKYVIMPSILKTVNTYILISARDKGSVAPNVQNLRDSIEKFRFMFKHSISTHHLREKSYLRAEVI